MTDAEILSLKEKVAVYEHLFHRIQLAYEVTLDSEQVRQYLDLISAWSYAHRKGNGELSEEEQNQLIDYQFALMRHLLK